MPPRRPAGKKGRGGHVERDVLKLVCQRLAAEREACHLLWGLDHCCTPAGCWGHSAGAGGRRPALPRVFLAAGLHWAAQGCGRAPQVLATDRSGSVGSRATAFGGAQGGGETCRNIITPSFLTRCYCCIIISSLWGKRGMHRSSRQAGDVTLRTQTTRKCFLASALPNA